MKKILLIFLFMLLITGCSANIEYNAVINTNNVVENISFITDMNEKEVETSEFYNYSIGKYSQDKNYNPYDTSDYQEGVIYYNKSVKGNIANYSQKFALSEYYNSGMAHNLLNNFNATYNNNILKINSGYINTYPENVNNIIVKYTTEYDVILNNADNIENNTYIWTFDKNNYKNKSVLLNIDFNSKQNSTINFSSIIFITIVIVIFIITYIFVTILNKKNNKL